MPSYMGETIMENIVKLYIDGELVDFKQEKDKFNDDYLFVAENGRFVKFPKEGNLEEMINNYNEANKKQVKLEPEVTYGEVETNE